jgi:hypothetical protein
MALLKPKGLYQMSIRLFAISHFDHLVLILVQQQLPCDQHLLNEALR